MKKDALADIEPERRNGYSWYGNWGDTVAKDYLVWQRKHKPGATAPAPE